MVQWSCSPVREDVRGPDIVVLVGNCRCGRSSQEWHAVCRREAGRDLIKPKRNPKPLLSSRCAKPPAMCCITSWQGVNRHSCQLITLPQSSVADLQSQVNMVRVFRRPLRTRTDHFLSTFRQAKMPLQNCPLPTGKLSLR
jgi:hypothetical protein